METNTECCICNTEWEIEEYESLDKDEKQQLNICKICKSLVCIQCRFKWQQLNGFNNTLDSFKCPTCRNIDWKHYFEEEILWFIKHSALDIESISDNIIGINHAKGIYPPPIYKYIEK